MRMGILLRRAFILPIRLVSVNMRVNQRWLVNSHIDDIITDF